MKVSKNNLKIVAAESADATNKTPDYSEAESHIKKAIEILGKLAKTDPKAKEAVANLGVTLFDLRQ